MHLGLPSYPIMTPVPRDPATSTGLRPMTTKRIDLRGWRGVGNSSDPDKAIEPRLGFGRTFERLFEWYKIIGTNSHWLQVLV